MAIMNRTQQTKQKLEVTELTTEQRLRYARRANIASEKREMDKMKEFINGVNKKAKQPLAKTKEKSNNIRYAVWSILFGVFTLWFMYMSETGGF